MIKFTVWGEPVAKGRGRVGGFGKRRWIVTPAKTQLYEDQVREAASEAMAGRLPLAGPCSVSIRFGLPVPASWPEKRRLASLISYWAPTGPDIDNMTKAVLDGMNKITFADDKLVCEILARKGYAAQACAFVEIKEL